MKSAPFDLSHWSVVTPETDEHGHAKHYTAQEVLKDEPRFCTLHEDHLRLYAPVHFAHSTYTDHTSTLLTELDDRGDPAAWLYREGEHILKASLCVDEVPSSGIILVAQVCLRDSARSPIRLRYKYKEVKKTGTLYLSVRTLDDMGLESRPVLENIPLGQRFKFTLHVTRQGTVIAMADDKKNMGTVLMTLRGCSEDRLYFKTGTFNIEDLRAQVMGEASVVRVYEAEVTHLPKL